MHEQRRSGTGAALRLFLTVWILYAIHATTNVARETYLAVSLGTRGSIRVDDFQGLHPDLFEMPGRGWYINNNPGASILGGAAYVLVRPAIALAVALRPEIAQPKPPATYDDPRPNRTKFMNAARARGVDITLGLAAIGIQVLLMAPLGALAAVLVYYALRDRVGSDREAVLWGLGYALATPMLFRSAFLNQNAIIAHAVLGAYLIFWRRSGASGDTRLFLARWGTSIAGFLLGLGLLTDYSTVPLALVFGLWAVADGWKRGAGIQGGIGEGIKFSLGALPPVLALLAYQSVAFGSPWFPAQRYMPPTEYSVIGWNGFSAPTAELLWGNLFDPRYGLFTFAPLLLAGLAVPWLLRRQDHSPDIPDRRTLAWGLAAVAALYLFSSANQFANLQWNTGVRYLVPAIPILYFAAVPVLRRLPLWISASVILSSLVISAAVSMMREDVPTSLAMLFTDGPTLPVLLVLRKMESAYAGLQFPWWTIWLVYAVLGVSLWALWRTPRRRRAVPTLLNA